MPIASATLLLVATVGGIIFAPLLERRRGMHAVALAFATGTLLTMVLTHVLPEAIEMNRGATIAFVVGFVLMMLVQQHVLRADPCCGHDHQKHAGLPSFLALALCSFNDGIVLSSAAADGLRSPLLWAMGIHEATAGFALALLLREVQGPGITVSKVIYLGVFACVAPVTFMAAHELTHGVTWMPYLLGASAGALLYVVAGSLVPRVEHLAREGRWSVLLAFIAAVAINIGLQMLAPCQHHHHGHSHVHGHEHGDGHDHEHDDEAMPPTRSGAVK